MIPFAYLKDPVDQSKIEVKREERKEKRLGNIKPHKGHTLFELNLKTKEIIPATFESVDYVVDGNKTFTTLNRSVKKVIERPDCVYISALNENNAIKKFFKSIGHGKQVDK